MSFFGLFGTTSTLDTKKNIITVTGNFGHSFKRAIERKLLKKKTKFVFIDVGRFSFSFYVFFEQEVIGVLDYMVTSGEFKYGVNLKNVSSAIKSIKSTESKLYNNKYTIDMSRLNQLNYTPLDYQLPIFDDYSKKKANGLRGKLLTAKVGSGKTFMSLAISVALGHPCVIVIVPKNTLLTTWAPAISDEIFKVAPTMITSVDLAKGQQYNGERYILVHAEFLPKLLDFVRGNRIKEPMIIVDETHGYTEVKSDRTKALMELVDVTEPSDVILMSGTAIKAKVREMMSFIIILEKSFTNTLRKRLESIYKNPNFMINMIAPARFNRYSVFVEQTSKELPELKPEFMIVDLKDSEQYTLEAVKAALTKYIDITTIELEQDKSRQDAIYIELREQAFINGIEAGSYTKQDVNSYKSDIDVIVDHYKRGALKEVGEIMERANQFERKLVANLPNERKKDFRNAKTFFKYLSLKVVGMALANVVLKTRIRAFTEIATAIDYTELYSFTTRKSIYFSNYIDVCNAIQESIKRDAQPLRPCTVFGDKTKELASQVKRFIKGDELDTPMIATYTSLSTGVNGLQFVADLVVTIDLPFREAVLTQAIGRARRNGQTSVVTHLQIQLNTGGAKNIADRGVDILKITGDEAARITGVASDVVVAGRVVTTEDYTDGYFNMLEDAGDERWAIEEALRVNAIDASWQVTNLVSEDEEVKPSMLDW